jgi:DNA replication protein DnaC
MLIQQTMNGLRDLRLAGMIAALEIQLQQIDVQALAFEDRLGMLVDAEMSLRDNKRLERLVKDAKFKELACIENINYDPKRMLNRSLIMTLATGNWVEAGQNLIITGATGTGKSWLACALGNQLCRRGISVKFFRLSRLIEQLSVAKGDGSLTRLRAQLAKASVLILDDWLMAPLDAPSAREILELIDDRTGKNSLILTSQFPVNTWHDRIGEPTVADAILDRIIHSAHRIEIAGDDSMRKLNGLNNSVPT